MNPHFGYEFQNFLISLMIGAASPKASSKCTLDEGNGIKREREREPASKILRN